MKPKKVYACVIAVASALALSNCSSARPRSTAIVTAAPSLKVAIVTDVLVMRDMRGGPDLFDTAENLDSADLIATVLSYDLEQKGYVTISSECAGFGVTYSTVSGTALIKRDKKTEQGTLPQWNLGRFTSNSSRIALIETVGELKKNRISLVLKSSSTLSGTIVQTMLSMREVALASKFKPVVVSAQSLALIGPDAADVVAILTVQSKRPTKLRSFLAASGQMALSIPLGPVAPYGITQDGEMDFYLVNAKTGKVEFSSNQKVGQGGPSVLADLRTMVKQLDRDVPAAKDD